MIALLVALPKELGPWFAASVFGGEYSIGQRVALMTAIGLAGRELAGFGREGGGAEDGERESFPSKTLPERLHRMYAQDSEMTALARRMEESVLTPVATKQRPRRKVVKNELAKVVAESFFLPLTAAFRERGAGGYVFIIPSTGRCSAFPCCQADTAAEQTRNTSSHHSSKHSPSSSPSHPAQRRTSPS